MNEPRDWNRWISGALLIFGVLIALVVISAVWGDNDDLSDDAKFLLAVGGILALLLKQIQHGDAIARTEAKVEQVVEAVNHVEEQEAIPEDGEPERATLGSLLRGVDGKVDDLLTRLDALEHPPAPPPAGTTVPQTARPAARPPSKRRKP